MSDDEGFLKFYLDVAYQLALWGILKNISDLDKFLTSLKTHGCITEAEYITNSKKGLTKTRRRQGLVEVLLSKSTDWKELGILDALNEADKQASDYAVLHTLQIFNGILDRVLERIDDTSVTKWGPVVNRQDVAPWLDRHCKRLAFQLTLPDVVASAPNLEQFCRTLRTTEVVTAVEWRELMKADANGVAVRLVNKEPEQVLNTLPPGVVSRAQDRMARAYGLALTAITGEVATQNTLKKFAVIGAISLGVGFAGALLAPVALAAVGFGGGGIAAGSAAAWFMSTYAGAVPAGSLCALLQSAGAAGIAASTSAGIAAGSGGVTFGALSGLASLIKRQRHKKFREYFSN